MEKQRLQSFYMDSVVRKLETKFSYSNKNNIPKLKKIIIKRNLNDSCQNVKVMDCLTNELKIISCQEPCLVRAKKAISGFKVKEGMFVSAFVTLRGKKMYSFLDRLINLVIPRISDFHGLSIKNFDSRGNYNLGLKEQLMFPEIEYDKVVKVEGMTITIVTNVSNFEESMFLLKELGMPFE
ncbi:MAG: 50S ribosomal protein L5 [Gammaproteobacteria bacterium]